MSYITLIPRMLSWEAEAMVGCPPQAGVRAKRGRPCEKLPGPLALCKGSKAKLAILATQPWELQKVGWCEGRRKTSAPENSGASLDACQYFLLQLL